MALNFKGLGLPTFALNGIPRASLSEVDSTITRQNPVKKTYPIRESLPVPKDCINAIEKDREVGYAILAGLPKEAFQENYKDDWNLQPGSLIFYYGVGGSLMKNVFGNKSLITKATSAANPISHWGIYIGEGHIMEIGPPRSIAKELCRHPSTAKMRGTRLVRVEDWLEWGSGDIYEKQYDKNIVTIDRKTIVERALALMSDVQYSVLGSVSHLSMGSINKNSGAFVTGNCEMLANYIATGIAESLQVKNVVRALKELALVVFFAHVRTNKNTGKAEVDLTDEGCICKTRCKTGWFGKKCIKHDNRCGKQPGEEWAPCAEGRRAKVRVDAKGKLRVRKVLPPLTSA